MEQLQTLEFLKQNGISLYDDYNIDDYVLNIYYASQFLEIAENNQIPIIGGEVYSKSNNGLIIGEYYYLAWSCECNPGENIGYKSYFERSLKMANENLNKIKEVSLRTHTTLYVNYTF